MQAKEFCDPGNDPNWKYCQEQIDQKTEPETGEEIESAREGVFSPAGDERSENKTDCQETKRNNQLRFVVLIGDRKKSDNWDI